ncbi:fungal-specific transcription factor domain-containing protein [Cercophora newfieldiana]|uniref:Fungal-specific transcription factor domain-containing protein n=1 Tax=Cercophora newfieldiana TaxID=92897 RepID=A0AA39YRT4_9PEZI|nr:fungal-specific transcription factor domain-containing protein [Cercophora newfieldiana]
MDRMDEDSPGEAQSVPGRSPSAPPASSGAGGKHPTTVSGPSPSSAASVPGPSSIASQGMSKRRRGLGIVTPNACTECRKKRAKCDGQRPCSRCAGQKDAECIYEIPVRQSKETLRNEIDQLRRQQRSSEQVLAALANPELWEEVLSRLRGGQSIEAISQWLGVSGPSGAGGKAPSAVFGAGFGAGAKRPGSGPGTAPGPRPTSPTTSQHLQSMRHEPEQQSPWAGPFSSRSQSRVGSWVEGQEESYRYHGQTQVPTPELPEMRVPPETWTTITSDGGLVQHLLALYFCWEYPTFASLSKEHFLKDFTDGRPRFCSAILVNALLALGCRFSSKPATRANPNDPHTSGDHFFKECQRLFYQEQDHHTLTTIQALGIMSIREASCGRDSESWYYAGQSIRLAIEMGLHQLEGDGHDDDETAVQAATFWGAFALDHAWSLATGSLPQCSCFPRLPPKPAIIDDIEASLWIPYTDDGKGISRLASALEGRLSQSEGAPLQRSCEQPSNVRSVYKCFCELSELVHQSLYVLHSPGRPLTSRDLLSIYTQYLNWYDRIPEVLRLGHNFTPAVLFAHMYYHFAILLLFRPLIKLRIIGSSISPRDVCSQAADAISGLLRSYSQLYTLRRTPSFVPYFVLTSSIMHLAIGATLSGEQQPGESESTKSGQSSQTPGRSSKFSPRVVEAITRGIADLTEMAPCHFFAEQALNILRFLARKWNIEVDITPTEEEKQIRHGGSDFDQTTKPVTSSLNFFSPNVEDSDFNCNWGNSIKAVRKTEQRTGDRGEHIAETASAMENPLFWPFPMQGRPMLPTGEELEKAGFELL